MQRDPARSEPTGSLERLWSCFGLWLLFKKAETALLHNIFQDVKLKLDPLQTHVGKATPMRILPRGYFFPFTVTGGLTSRLPNESKLFTLLLSGSLVT